MAPEFTAFMDKLLKINFKEEENKMELYTDNPHRWQGQMI